MLYAGGDNQKWTFNSSDNTIRGVGSGLCLDVGSIVTCMDKPLSTYPYCNYTLDPLTRAKDLVSRLTLAEKVGACKSNFQSLIELLSVTIHCALLFSSYTIVLFSYQVVVWE